MSELWCGTELPTTGKLTTHSYLEENIHTAVSVAFVLVLFPPCLYSTLPLRAVQLRPVLLGERCFASHCSAFVPSVCRQASMLHPAD